jgi:MFS family permease
MDTKTNRGGRLGPLAEPQFRRLYLARALSLFGDALVPVALAFGVLAVDGSPSALGFVLASRFASLVMFLLIAGVIADRLPRKAILVGSDLVRLAAQSITATILVTNTATVWELVLLAFVYGAGEAFFRPTSTGFVPETISPARLQQANALLAATTSACTVLGPVVAGVMVATMGPGWAIAADAFTFFLSAVFLSRIRTTPPGRRQGTTLLRDLADGWRVFRSETWLWVDGVYSALGNCAVFAPLLALGPVVALRSLGGAGAWATIVAALGVGSVLGGLVLLRARPARPLFGSPRRRVRPVGVQHLVRDHGPAIRGTRGAFAGRRDRLAHVAGPVPDRFCRSGPGGGSVRCSRSSRGSGSLDPWVDRDRLGGSQRPTSPAHPTTALN